MAPRISPADLNGGIRRLARAVLVLFLALAGYVFYLQVVAADQIAAREENARGAIEEAEAPRGTIFSRDGKVLAQSVPSGVRQFRRVYPQGSLTSHIVGYVSRKYGRTGIEAAENRTLSGIAGGRMVDRLLREGSGATDRGRDVTLTLDATLQRRARELLRGRRGAIAMMDVRTGGVLAAYSNPTFRPDRIDASFESYRRADSAPLLNRAFQGLYPPGSTFKTVTAAAALQSRAAATDTEFFGPKVLRVFGSTVTNYRDQTCGKLTLRQAFAKSCNTIFAQVGLDLGAARLKSASEGFGFNRRPPLEVPSTASRFPDPSRIDPVDVAWSAVGQADVLATPLQMALVTAAVANGGRLPRAHLVEKRVSVGGAELVVPELPAGRVLDPEVASDMQRLMESVVKEGTGRRAGGFGVSVAGKTGTAEVERGASHAWFIGYAPADNPRAAVAVIVEHGGTGGAVAAPIAGRMLAAATR